MKVVHILKGKANPNTMNGVNKVVHHLATEQLRLGIDVEVWGITATPKDIRHQHRYPLRLFSGTRSRFTLSKPLYKELRALSPVQTVVHLHSVFLPELYAVSRILEKRKVPWVLTPHGGYAPQSMKKNRLSKLIYMMLFEKKVIFGAMRVHAIGASEVSDLKHMNENLNVVLIPNGQSFEEVKFDPVYCTEPNERPVFGFCGRMAKDHKGLDLLIRGFARYKKGQGIGELWLIGDGPDTAYLRELATKEGVKNSVRFLGSMFGNEKLTYLARMDIFVHTSRWDVIPTAVLEAAALGKPLLVSKETNMGDYLSRYRNGFLLTENSVENIEQAVFRFEKLFLESKLSSLGEKSKKLVEKELNWATISKKLSWELYSFR